MKKILFVTPSLTHGGPNRVLFNQLSMLDKSKYDIDIFSIANEGPYKEIFSDYNLLPENLITASVHQRVGYIKKQGLFWFFVKMSIKAFFMIALSIWEEKAYKLLIKSAVNKLQGYDSVVAIQEGAATRFVQHINAKNKVACVRCDYSYYDKIFNKDESQIYSSYTNIICVSRYTREVFLNFYPFLKEKVHAVHNVLDGIEIRNLSKVEIIDDRFENSDYVFMSIGRLSQVKQFDMIPKIAKQLLLTNIKFKWYIIGDGKEYSNIESSIISNDVSEVVILLGEKGNPYPYLSKSDVLVCTSESEAYPTVINEAKLLDVFVVTTNFSSAKEIVDDKIDGYIVSESEIAVTLENLMKKGFTKTDSKKKTNYELINKNNLKQFESFLNND